MKGKITRGVLIGYEKIVQRLSCITKNKVSIFITSKNYNMKKLSFSLATVMIILMTSLSGCSAIGGIFKAGMWTGVIGIALVVFLVIFLISRSRR